MAFAILLVILVLAWVIYRHTSHIRINRGFIDQYQFPKKISEQVSATYPHLSDEQVELVIRGLREYFHLCGTARLGNVAMPSQVVDLAWHEFILFTREYDWFCQQAFGRFLHHTPAEAMESQMSAQASIRKTWQLSCQRQNLPAGAIMTELPILFAMDARLNIEDGFKYALNCDLPGNHHYCASHIASSTSAESQFGGGCSSCSSGCGGGD